MKPVTFQLSVVRYMQGQFWLLGIGLADFALVVIPFYSFSKLQFNFDEGEWSKHIQNVSPMHIFHGYINYVSDVYSPEDNL